VPTFTKSNSAEDIALALLEQLELKVQGGYYIISDGKNIILSFSRIEDLPSITAIYEQGSRNMSLRGIDPIDSSLILKSIGSDLMAIFEAETKKLKELETQRILTKLSPITQRLIECT
jgi:type IV secretory pathway VirB9-like protein